MILEKKDSGSVFHIKINDIFSVHLQENPTTGYKWDIDDARGFKLLKSYFKPGEGIGSEGLRIFQFKIENIGLSELHLKNWREWEGPSSIIDRFYAKFIVNT